MTFSAQELRAWAQLVAETHIESPGWWELATKMLIIGHLHGLEVACEHSRHKGDRKRIDGLIEDAKGAMAAAE
jgi:hypothetical protein